MHYSVFWVATSLVAALFACNQAAADETPPVCEKNLRIGGYSSG